MPEQTQFLVHSDKISKQMHLYVERFPLHPSKRSVVQILFLHCLFFSCSVKWRENKPSVSWYLQSNPMVIEDIMKQLLYKCYTTYKRKVLWVCKAKENGRCSNNHVSFGKEYVKIQCVHLLQNKQTQLSKKKKNLLN